MGKLMAYSLWFRGRENLKSMRDPTACLSFHKFTRLVLANQYQPTAIASASADAVMR
jgi:hypothetical protein